MYFNHAFRKSFLPASTTLRTSGTTADLTAGQIGFFNSKTFAAQASGTIVPFILAQGSYFTSDKIGGNRFLGGYQESVKSKTVNPKYISRVIKVSSKTPLNHIEHVSISGLECGKTYRLRLDLKGSPALRYLSHNVYRTLDAFTGCCTDDCSATCTGAAVDPNVALLLWADQVTNNPILPSFITAVVWNQTFATVAIDPTATSATIVVANAVAANFVAGNTVVAAGFPVATRVVSVGAADSAGAGFTYVALSQVATSSTNVNADIYESIATATYTPQTTDVNIAAVVSYLELTAAYEETKFGNCTFTPTDFYELMPLKIIASLTDESGDACNVQGVTFTTVQEPAQASGVGETVLRELILDGRYLQNAYPDSTRVDSLRMREIEADPALATVTRSALYDQVLILHSVPRFYNPTGTFDNDQYLLKLHVPAGTSTTSITNFVIAAADAAQGSGAVVLESY